MFSKVLIANRGEIAVRIMRACEELGIATVAVYSELDRDAVHVKRADEAYLLGPGPATESYLVIDKLIDAVHRSEAEAVHPGYGFLAENAAFVSALEQAGITFVGPPASAIEAMGSKTRARELMAKAGVPIVPGTTEHVVTIEDARKVIADTIGYPVAVKAAGGGGGKGFRVALDESKLEEAFEGAAREGEKFFSDSTVYLERYLPDPRHVEVQVLADTHGNVIHLGERDCSLQRRHQKLIEESPAPAVDDELRARIGKIATEAAAAVSYTGAGTIEGLLQDGEYFFLEMNTRVQVEHCVTEMVTGIDIVKEGIRVAAGEPLSISQDEVVLRGHSIECRINAEDASKNFAPAPGTIGAYSEPGGPGVRVDSGVGPGSEISPMYDPMVAKLIVWDVDREAARRRMLRALDEYVVDGPATLIPFHKWLFGLDEFIAGGACHDELARLADAPTPLPDAGRTPLGGGAEPADEVEPQVVREFTAEVDGRRVGVRLSMPASQAGGGGPAPAPRAKTRGKHTAGSGKAGQPTEAVTTPMQGTVLRVLVVEGQDVAEGDVICIVEAMKMENEVAAHRAGVVKQLSISEGQSVDADQVIAIVD
ncbi:MAG TPA: acetyl-CoA carboxylase biotin carboxylase subunit [Acidimicrobiales bacterium]|nr:acetyl-CoA carboxylase biotin carboxylase subunit [Acidimicrobiales bacterium]